MPLNIPDKLPAYNQLLKENIFVMKETTALRQDIRPQRIGIMNLMPVKITTENHILRLLSNSPLQVEIDLIKTKTHHSKNTPVEHLEEFYKTFDEINHKKYDGFIITGAPVEHIPFEQVDYWEELKTVMNWTRNNVTSTLFICWAAQAGLYYLYNIPKYDLDKKMFGVYEHYVNNTRYPLVRGFDDIFVAPHSRRSEVRRKDIEKNKELFILSESDTAGIYIVIAKKGKEIFVTGHSEYDPYTLKNEYIRDKKKGLDIDIPDNYFKDNDPSKEPIVRWRSHANLLFSNWLNYHVYQLSPYDQTMNCC